MSAEDDLDAYVPAGVRAWIEQAYYARINEQATLDHLLGDPAFLEDPEGHIALFSDHGVVHVRDVARRMLEVLEVINGVLMPLRPGERLDGFMKRYGVMAAYLHDIGMADFSPFGRGIHPEFASQAVFEPAFDDVVETVWDANAGRIAGRLRDLAARGALEQAPEIVWREILAMTNCHSKRSVPVAVLDDPVRLREVMQDTLRTDLHALYHRRRMEAARRQLVQAQQEGTDTADLRHWAQALFEAEAALAGSVHPSDPATPRGRALRRFYSDFEREAFCWLLSPHPDVRDLVDDVVDTLRALRCADALRQRGTVLKTSGAYEVFVDQTTAHAVCALRRGPEQSFLLSLPDPVSAGEANLAYSALSPDGDLQIAFHRGAFVGQDVVLRAAYCAAVVVHDVQLDVIGSFQRPSRSARGPGDGVKREEEIMIVLEGVDDNPAFAGLVGEHLALLDPDLRERIRIAPAAVAAPLVLDSAREHARYATAAALDWDLARRQATLANIARAGHKTTNIDPIEGFERVKVVTLRAGDTLIEAGAPSEYVYIALEGGLEVVPLGGYQPLSIHAWLPVGNTGVIRGASRNGTVVTGRDVTLLMIPRDVYLQRWHDPYSAVELLGRLTSPARLS